MVPDTKNMTLRLEPELAEQLQTIADVEGLPISEIVRLAIRDLVAARRKDKRFQKRLEETVRDQQRILRQLQERKP
jgi:predicted transcriptional regulator